MANGTSLAPAPKSSAQILADAQAAQAGQPVSQPSTPPPYAGMPQTDTFDSITNAAVNAGKWLLNAAPMPESQPAPAAPSQTFAMTFPDGSRAMVPSEKTGAAYQKGGKLIQPMTFPDGSRSFVPFDRVHDAMAKGGQFMPWGTFQKTPIAPPQPQMQDVMALTSGPDPLNLAQRAVDQTVVPWLQGHAQQQLQEEQRNVRLATGPESANVSTPAAVGHAIVAPMHRAEAVLSGMAAATLTDPKAAGAMAAGTIDPAIPLAYFQGQGIGGLTGIGTGRPSSALQAYRNPTPENTQTALFDAAQTLAPVEGFRAPVVEGFEGGGAIPQTQGAVNAPIDPGFGRSIGLVGQGASTALGPVINRLRTIYDPAELSATEAATKAFRPRNSVVNWQDDIGRALPLMKRSADSLGIDVNNMTRDDAFRTVDDAAREDWAEYKRNHLGPNAEVTVNTQPVADAMRSKITKTMREQDPAQVQQIEQIASTFDNREMTIDEVQQRVSELNNQTRAIEGRYLADKRAAKLDPGNAYIFAQRDSLRSLMDDRINQLSGPGAAELRRNYGALRSVEDVIQRRQNVVDRGAREPLSAMLAKAYSAAHIVGGVLHGNPLGVLQGIATIAAERRARALQDPDYLTQLAFQKTEAAAPWSPTTPEGPRLPTQAEQVAARAAQLAGAQQQGIPFPEGPLFEHQQTPAPQTTGPFEMPASTAAVREQGALPPAPERGALPAGPPAGGRPAQLPAPGETAPARPGPTGPFNLPPSLIGPQRPALQPAGLPERNIAPTSGFEAPTAPSTSAEYQAVQEAAAQGRGPQPEAEPTAEGYGSQNKIVTQEEYEQAKQDLTRDLMGGMKAGVPLTPENLARATKIGMYHLEAGARSFAAWSKAMLGELGEGIKPHLRGIWDQIQAAIPGAEHVVSTRNPTGKPENLDFDPHTDRSKSIGTKEILDAGIGQDVADAISQYPGMKGVLKGATDPRTVMQRFVKFAADNMVDLYNRMPAAVRDMSKRWYPSANKLANDLVTKHAEHGLTMPQAAAIIAVHSPQTDWNINASQAQRTSDIWLNHQDTPYSEAMANKAKELATPSIQPELQAIQGKTLREVSAPLPADASKADIRQQKRNEAMWIRLYDEAENPSTYEIWRPDGTTMGIARNEPTKAQLKAGELGDPTKLSWGNLNNVAKAISVMKDGSMENISDALGTKHKVRNFYNNIVNPRGLRGDVTVDTHQVGAGLYRPVSGDDIGPAHNFGSGKAAVKDKKTGEILEPSIPGAGSNQNAGVYGTYGLYADATRQAAQRVGEQLPQFMQSMTWEGVRSLFPDTFKTKANKTIIDNIWREVDSGDLTPAQARTKIINTVAQIKHPENYRLGAFDRPEWGSDIAGNEGQGTAANPQNVAGTELPIRSPRSAGGGAGGGNPRGSSRQVIPANLRAVMRPR